MSLSALVDSIKTDHFPPGRNINKSIQQKQVNSDTNLSRRITLFPSLGLVLGLRLLLGLGLGSN